MKFDLILIIVMLTITSACKRNKNSSFTIIPINDSVLIYSEFHTNGMKRINAKMDIEKQFHGEYNYYDSLGKLKLQSYFIHGDKNGIELKYWPNGKLLSQEIYVDGKLNGDKIQFWINGDTLSITKFENGKKLETIDF